MPAPVIFGHVAQRSIDAALSCYCVRTSWKLVGPIRYCLSLHLMSDWKASTSFVMHAVSSPDWARPTAARRPAPPAPTTIALENVSS